MNRMCQAVMIVSTLLGSWLGMQAVHECGHVLGAWATGGTVTRVILHPLTISRTDLGNNPAPLIVVWAGPLFGVLAPLVLWYACSLVKFSGAFVLRFFAGFCLIANGIYLGAGSFGGIGDCGEMLQHGSAIWHLWLFGALALPAGLYLWNGQSRHFGFGPDGEKISDRIVAATALACLGLVAIGLARGR